MKSGTVKVVLIQLKKRKSKGIRLEVKGNKAGAFIEDTQLITCIYTKDTEGSGSKDLENTNGTRFCLKMITSL